MSSSCWLLRIFYLRTVGCVVIGQLLVAIETAEPSLLPQGMNRAASLFLPSSGTILLPLCTQLHGGRPCVEFLVTMETAALPLHILGEGRYHCLSAQLHRGGPPALLNKAVVCNLIHSSALCANQLLSPPSSLLWTDGSLHGREWYGLVHTISSHAERITSVSLGEVGG